MRIGKEESLLDEVSDYRHGAFRCVGDCRQ
jgi:hypothetical protein